MEQLPVGIKNNIERARGRALTERQEHFLALVERYDGNIQRAYEESNYKIRKSLVISQLKKELLEMTELMLVEEAPNSVNKLLEIRDSEVSIPNVASKLDASKTILDRVGIGKKDRLEIDNKVSGGLFIIPAKGQLVHE